MTLDEMVIRMRVGAEGMKQGVAAASKELQKLREHKKHLEEKLKMEVSAPALAALRENLKALQEQKKELEHAVRIPIDSEGAAALKQELEEILAERAMLEEDLKVHMDAADWQAATEELARLNAEKTRLEGEIKLRVQADAEQAKNALLEIDRSIADAQREIVLKMDAGGINDAKAALQDVDAAMKEAEKSAAGLERQKAKLAAVGAAAFAGIALAAKSGIDAYNDYAVSVNGLAAQLEHMGESGAGAMGLVKEKTADGLLSPDEAAAAIRMLTEYGMTVEQAARTVDRLKDAAAYGRRENVAYGESVKRAAQGILTESAQMAKAAGVMKNLSDMHKDYAASLGKTVDELSQAERAQAAYAGIMTETERHAGNAAQYAEGLAGAQAILANETGQLAAAFGEALAPAVQAGAQALTEMARGVRGFVQGNQTLAAAIAALVAAYAGLTMAVNGAKIAKTTLIPQIYALATAKTAATGATAGLGAALGALALNPVVLGLTALAGAAAIVVSETKKYEQEQGRLNDAIERYNALMAEDPTETKIEDYRQNIAAAEALAKAIEAEMAAHEARQRQAREIHETSAREMQGDLELLKESEKWKKENAEALSQLGVAAKDASGGYRPLKALLADVTQAGEANARAKKAAAEAAREAAMAETDHAAALDESLKKLNELESAHGKAAGGAALSRDELFKLIATHEELAQFIATTADWQDKLAGKLDEMAEAARRNAIATLQAENEKTQAVVEQTRQRIEAYRAELQALKLLGESDYGMGLALGMEMDKLNASLQGIAENEAKIAALQAGLSRGNGGGGRSSGGSRAAQAQRETNEELEKAKKLLEGQIALTEMSAAAQIEGWERVRRHARNPGEEIEIDRRLYALRRQALDDWHDEEMRAIARLNKGRADNTDFQGMADAYAALLAKVRAAYAEYPETLKKLEESLTEHMEAAAQNRADKLLAIEARGVDGRIAEMERLIQKSRNMNGVLDGDGNAHAFGAPDEADAVRKIQRLNEQRIAALMDAERGLTDAEHSELQRRLAERERYAYRIEDLEIQSIKDRQAAEQKALADSGKAAEKWARDQEAAAKAASRAHVEAIKSRHAEELRLAEERAAAEINVYQERINAIDRILKAESRAESDAGFDDKMARLKNQLAFEADPGNAYALQKEIDRLQAEQDKRKRKESLEDERDGLQGQIAAARDALAEHKAMLLEKRDAEIKAAEEALGIFLAGLGRQAAALKEKEGADTDAIRAEQKKRMTDEKKHADEKFRLLEQNSRNERALASRTTDGIVSDLYRRISDFAEAGRQAGQAWADAYGEAVSHVMHASGVAAYGAAAYGGHTVHYHYDNQVTQHFNVPTVTPHKAAAETERALERMTRHL